MRHLPAERRVIAMIEDALPSHRFRVSNSQDLGHAWASYFWVYDSECESTFQQPHRAFPALDEEGLREQADFWIAGFETVYQIPSRFRIGRLPPDDAAGQHVSGFHGEPPSTFRSLLRHAFRQPRSASDRTADTP